MKKPLGSVDGLGLRSQARDWAKGQPDLLCLFQREMRSNRKPGEEHMILAEPDTIP